MTFRGYISLGQPQLESVAVRLKCNFFQSQLQSVATRFNRNSCQSQLFSVTARFSSNLSQSQLLSVSTRISCILVAAAAATRVSCSLFQPQLKSVATRFRRASQTDISVGISDFDKQNYAFLNLIIFIQEQLILVEFK